MGRSQEDIRHRGFWRSVISEFVGSVFLLAVGCGAWSDVDHREHSWTVKVSLAFGLTYTAAIYSARVVSDAHVNPIITVAMLTTRRISFARGALYVTAQFLGAVFGAAISLVFGNPVVTSPEVPDDKRAPSGCTVPGHHVTESQAFAVELLASFFFVFVVFACYDKSSRSDFGSKVKLKVKEREDPFVIGLAYTGVLLFAEIAKKIFEESRLTEMESFNATKTSSSSWSVQPATPNITIDDFTVSSPFSGNVNTSAIIASTILATFGLVGIVSNFLVLLSYKFEQKLRSNFQILIRNQAAADLLVCAITMPMYTVYTFTNYWLFGPFLCGVALVFDYGGSTASVYSLVAICVDRLWATKWCHHYRKYNTRKKVAIMCFIVWFLSASIVGYPVISSQLLTTTRDDQCMFVTEDNAAFFVAWPIVAIGAPIVFVLASYSVVYHEIRRLARPRPEDRGRRLPHDTDPRRADVQIVAKIVQPRKTEQIWHIDVKETTNVEAAQPQHAPGTGRDGNATKDTIEDTKMARDKKTDGTAGTAEGEAPAEDGRQQPDGGEQHQTSAKSGRKSFVTLSYVVVAHIICWFPIGILMLMSDPNIAQSTAVYWLYWLPFVNSGLNPVVYTLSSAEFRSTVVKMMKFGYCRASQ